MLASVFALIGLLCLQITCVWCKERVAVPERPKGEKLNYLHVIKEIAKNKALLGVMFFSLVGMIGASVVNGLNTYLFKDYFGNVKIRLFRRFERTIFTITFAITTVGR
ncbi:MAG: MFS transporter [Ruthenibacterium lactatiformans]